MKKLYTLLIVIPLVFFSSSCKKFLDVAPSTTSVNPTTVSDFEQMLNSDSLAMVNYFYADLMTDDVYLFEQIFVNRSSPYSRTYLWEEQIWGTEDTDPMYNSSYVRILQMNIILSKIDEAPLDNGKTIAEKNTVKAQALINRASYYLQLANLYGKHYNATTAATDLAVPLILMPNANPRPARATVKEVYDQVISDLTTAINTAELPGMGVDIIHPGKAAAHALLARTYLYMQDYPKALEQANACLAIKSTIANYRTAPPRYAQLEDLIGNPEIILARLCVERDFYLRYGVTISAGSSLRTLLSFNDYRRTSRFNSSALNYNFSNINDLAFDYSIAVPEVMLIKAECLARSPDSSAALPILNTIRANRYSFTTPLSEASGIKLNLVLRERRLELFYRGGLRLFDLKRLHAGAGQPTTLTRIDVNGTVLSTLAPASPRYVLPFAPSVITVNPNIVQNPR